MNEINGLNGINRLHGTNGLHGLYAALCDYAGSDYYPYHMPGHKRSGLAGEMARYYHIDITEIDDFDNLHQAAGILKEAQERANRLYGAEETFYLVNGSTCGVLASIMTVTRRGDEILIARNCHRSVYHGAILQELTLHYYNPPFAAEYGICGGVDAAEIDCLLEQYPCCKAVVITSPTYEGVISDIDAIAKVVHARGKILIVDEAHGAHFGLADFLPAGAVACGADLVIHSLHKTLPAMTQTALLHVQGTRIDRTKLRKYLAMLQTSSPSYVMMASMDSCIRYVEDRGAEQFANMRRQYELFMEKIRICRHIEIINQKSLMKKGQGVIEHAAGWDMGKLVISVQNDLLSGQQLYEILRKEYHLQMEMAAKHYTLAIMTLMDSEEGWQRLADALIEIDDRIEREEAQKGVQKEVHKGAQKEVQADAAKLPTHPAHENRQVMSIADAFHGEKEEVALEESPGRIVADFINLYPPGIPLLVPGEVMDAETVSYIEECVRMGLHVQGVTAAGVVVAQQTDCV